MGKAKHKLRLAVVSPFLDKTYSTKRIVPANRVSRSVNDRFPMEK
jgi:hypothetical protein